MYSPIWNRVHRCSLKNIGALTSPNRVLLACMLVKRELFLLEYRFKGKFLHPHCGSLDIQGAHLFLKYIQNRVTRFLWYRVLHRSQMYFYLNDQALEALSNQVLDNRYCTRVVIHLLTRFFSYGMPIFSSQIWNKGKKERLLFPHYACGKILSLCSIASGTTNHFVVFPYGLKNL